MVKSMNFNTLLFELDNCVAVITLNRPKSANGFNSALASDLKSAAKYCDSNPDIRAVLLTANGSFFCVGGDIKEMASHGDKVENEVKKLADDLHMAISTFARMEKPVVVAVNGMAAGAGFSLAISGDIVLTSDTAAFTMAYTKAGLSPDGSSSYYLPRLIGLRRAQELMLTNRTLTAEEALDWGLVTRLVPESELLESALGIAKELAMGSQRANAAVKKLLMTTFTNTLETQMEIEGREIAACAAAPDGREGISAFVEKRKPNFS